MTYFCYVYSEGAGTPHMEALAAQTLHDAKTQSSRMVTDRRRAVRAEVFDEHRCVAVISRNEALAQLHSS